MRDPAGRAPLAGLSAAEARARLRAHGANELVERERLGWLRDSLRLLADPMAVMLAAVATVYFIVGETRDGWLMLAALVPVLGVDVILEARSRSALKRLAEATAPLAVVVRDGVEQTVAPRDIVPGDVLVLREGLALHADGVIRTAANLSADESPLTGESAPVTKQAFSGAPEVAPEDARFFAGSTMSSGQGLGEVVATGRETRFGAVASLLSQVDAAPTPLQRKTGRLVRRLSVVATAVAVIVFLISWFGGQNWTTALLGSISLAMAAIPEEFAIVFTLFLTMGAWGLSRHGILVRRLAAVETLGSVTVICTDKTGTLTWGRFDLKECVPAAGVTERALLDAALAACELSPADAMEKAIVAFAAEHGAREAAPGPGWQLLLDYDFDPVGKHMSHVWGAPGAGAARIAAKGALEGILAHCAVDEATRRGADEANAGLAGGGMRVLGVAARDLPTAEGDRESHESGLRFLGLLGFQDPLRPEAKAAAAELHGAGITVKMITGDHALTAYAIAEAAGLTTDPSTVVSGATLETMSGAALDATISHAVVFARTTPAQKHAIVDSLRRSGEIVAMTGDGINDAPAMRRADVGVAMGKRGTATARGAADLVLLGDDLGSISTAVRDGRHLFSNLRAAFLYVIAFHVPIVGLSLLSPLTGSPLVLMPIHLIWLELIIHPVSALVFQGDKPDAGLMRRRPRPPNAPLLPRAAVIRAALLGAAVTAAAFGVFRARLPAGEALARGTAFATVLLGCQLAVWIERHALKGTDVPFLAARWLAWVTWSIAGLTLPAVFYVPSMAAALHVAPLDGLGWAIASASAVAATLWRPVLDHFRPVDEASRATLR